MAITEKTTEKSVPIQPVSEKILRGDPDKQKKQYTVFLVEDDIDDQELAVRTLRRSPYIYNIHCFQTGNKLLQYLAGHGYYSGGPVHHLPAMILLDIHIPGANGIELLQELKDHPLTADIPVIIITNDSSQQRASEALKLNANAFIAKPIHLDHIHEVIETGWGWPKKNNK